MKKSFFFLGVLIATVCSFFSYRTNEVKAAETTTTKLRIHYYRTTGNYTGWNLWTWPEAPVGGEGEQTNFTGTDSYGRYADLDLSSGKFAGATKVGFIVRLNNWEDKDIASDRFVTIPAVSENGLHEVWVYQGLKAVYFSQQEAQSDKVMSAIFSTMRTVTVKLITSETITANKVHVYSNDQEMNEYAMTFDTAKKIVNITFDDAVPIDRGYKVKIDFSSGARTLECNYGGLYTTSQFTSTYVYDGDDLGVTFDYQRQTTTFKLWAPVSRDVVLKLYNTGTPKRLGGSDTPIKSYYMTKGEKGVWTHIEPAILHNIYYTYLVTNGESSNETIDPYAKGCGVNGLRGLVVDFDQINREVQFVRGVHPNKINKPTDAIIYEAHVRDMTKDATWSGNPLWAGKYLGLTQTGTTYTQGGTTVTTGLDHIKELGITHMQIMPFYDQASIDESLAEPNYNWGYDPLNYNCLEGSYATNAHDGLVRIREFKQMVKSLTDAGIAINMDVVYNHTSSSSNSNFNKIVPDYYHRMNDDMDYWNGSGCGNEMASERAMVRKFMVDSTKFWMSEYNVSGYRFDLMALIDTTTMKEISAECAKIYNKVLIYGEPWTGGTSGIKGTATNAGTIGSVDGVGMFNDQLRDGLRGKNDESGAGNGMIFGNASASEIAKVKAGIEGKYDSGKTYAPTKVIQYVACHDNFTLHDQVQRTTKASGDTLIMKNNQADSVVFMSEGIPFILAGQEFLRTKPKVAGVGEGSTYDHNSYRSPDSVNAIKWDRKVTFLSANKYYRDLVKFRKQHNVFRLDTRNDVTNSIEFIESTANVFSYRMRSSGSANDKYGDMIVVHNFGSLRTWKIPYETETWRVIFNKTGIVENSTNVTSVSLAQNETAVIYNINKVNTSFDDKAYGEQPPINWDVPDVTSPGTSTGTNPGTTTDGGSTTSYSSSDDTSFIDTTSYDSNVDASSSSASSENSGGGSGCSGCGKSNISFFAFTISLFAVFFVVTSKKRVF